MRAILTLLITVLTLAGCGSQQPSGEQVMASNPPQRTGSDSSDAAEFKTADDPAGAVTPLRIFAVGDMAGCNTTNDDAVAKYLRARTPRILTLGDNVYNVGSAKEFAECFDPIWGPMRDRVYPAVGNHEYLTPDATGYFDYFGARAGARDKGYYGFNLGDHWKVLVLNSQCGEIGGCASDSPQGVWLKGALARAGGRNVIATMHAPRYSSGDHGSTAAVKPLFRILYQRGADILLSGHDHDYERFAPQNATGDRRAAGVQQFVVGTGGRGLYPFGPRLANTRARNNTTYGVLRLDLAPDGYSWKFVPVLGDYTDSGSRSL